MINEPSQNLSSIAISSQQVGHLVTLACLEECSAPKPGNVHRSADFEDVSFYHFQTSAVCLGSIIDRGSQWPVGKTILEAVRQTQQSVGSNTNLGLVLLLVPLAKTVQSLLQQGREVKLSQNEMGNTVEAISLEDGQQVFEAIRLASPGGLGKSDSSYDVNQRHDPIDLIEAMRHGADRDSIARQYAFQFQDVLEVGPRLLSLGTKWFSQRADAIVFAHVAWLAIQGDSLIARKCGSELNQQTQDRAAHCLESLNDTLAENWINEIDNLPFPDSQAIERYWQRVGELDFWLRSDGHRRNPGTTADLIGASLFVQHVQACTWL